MDINTTLNIILRSCTIALPGPSQGKFNMDFWSIEEQMVSIGQYFSVHQDCRLLRHVGSKIEKCKFQLELELSWNLEVKNSTLLPTSAAQICHDLLYQRLPHTATDWLKCFCFCFYVTARKGTTTSTFGLKPVLSTEKYQRKVNKI